MIRWTRNFTVMVAALSLGACAASTQKSKMEELQESVDAYNQAYRWKNYERASAFLPNDLRAAFVATYEEEENSLHIEDYRILKVTFSNDDAAQVVVRFRFLLLPSVVVQNRKVVQAWHNVAGSWIMEDESNSIREVDLDAIPKNPDAFGGPEVPPEKEGATEVDAFDPEGNVIRRDGAPVTDPNDSEPDAD